MKKKFRYVFHKKKAQQGKLRNPRLRNPRLRIQDIASLRSRKTETKKCEIASCRQPTREGKPYCPDHIEHHPYISKLLGQLEEKELEEAAVKEKGRRAIKEGSLTAQEFLTYLKIHGGRTAERIARDLQLDINVVEHYAKYLAAQKKVKISSNRRGKTIVKPIKSNLRRRNPEFPISRGAANFELLLAAEAPFIIAPSGSEWQMKTSLHEKLYRVLHTLDNIDAWKALWVGCGRLPNQGCTKIFLISKHNERYELIDVCQDYGKKTGWLMARHIGPQGTIKLNIPRDTYETLQTVEGLMHVPYFLPLIVYK